MENKIQLTLAQLTAAAYSGAYARFSQIRKTISASHKNRKVPKAFGDEMKSFEAARDDIVKQFHGTPNALTRNYEWPPEEEVAAKKAMTELLAQGVDLPGCKISLAELLDGGLLESDYDALEPFLGD